MGHRGLKYTPPDIKVLRAPPTLQSFLTGGKVEEAGRGAQTGDGRMGDAQRPASKPKQTRR
eukprot:6102114-Pyramimonas_sp.AAC.1